MMMNITVDNQIIKLRAFLTISCDFIIIVFDICSLGANIPPPPETPKEPETKKSEEAEPAEKDEAKEVKDGFS